MKEYYDGTMDALHKIVTEKTSQPKQSSHSLRNKKMDK